MWRVENNLISNIIKRIVINTRCNNGYTLVELMIATVVGMIIVAGATVVFIVQNRSYASTERVSEVNSQSKTAMDIMAKEIRLAGMGMDAEAARLGLVAINPSQDGGTDAADSISVMAGFNSKGTLSTTRFTGPFPAGSRNTIYVQNAERKIRRCAAGPGAKCWLNIDGLFFAKVINCTATDSSDSNLCTSPNDDTGLVLNRDLPPDLRASLIAVSDSNGDGQINGDDRGRPVYGMINVTYFVNNNMELIRNDGVNDEAIAENIEDLQFTYLDDTGLFVNGDVANADEIKAVQVSLLARASQEDLGVTTETPPAVLANRIHDITGDGFRRRLWQSVVNLRNF